MSGGYAGDKFDFLADILDTSFMSQLIFEVISFGRFIEFVCYCAGGESFSDAGGSIEEEIRHLWTDNTAQISDDAILE
jgi:hypothetical protein